MPKYRVEAQELITIEVEAEDEDEACMIMINKLDNNEFGEIKDLDWSVGAYKTIEKYQIHQIHQKI